MFTLYKSEILGSETNCRYPHQIVVNDVEDLKFAVSKDYVCAKYKDDYRSKDNFISSDCVAVDFDNTHSDDPKQWITKEDLMVAFPGVEIGIHYSRNNMKEKGGKAARPKFHAFFPIRTVTNEEEYVELKKIVNTRFPFCDTGALDAARFFYGTKEQDVELIPGMNLTDFLDEEEFDKDFNKIQEGSRNSTMSRFASRILKKYGDTDEAYNAFMEKSELCAPPLEDEELKKIWKSALKFFKKISESPDYVPAEKYNDNNSYKPDDYTDADQAKVLAKYFSNELRYSGATHFIRFKGNYWKETDVEAQAVVHELTRRQVLEAKREVQKTSMLLASNGMTDILAMYGKKSDTHFNEEQRKIYKEFQDANAYKKFALMRRDSKYITSCLKEARPLLSLDVKELDADPFLLNTPSATYDLRKGLNGAKPHDPEDFITKITSVSPSYKGQQLWLDCLKKIFNDADLIDYVQMICGLTAIGKVFEESLIISYGDGGNGKSTFWNSISKVLGLYSGRLSADALTVNCKRNVKPEMAEINGKRLLIASESQEGARLDDSIVKQLCSTDDIQGEKKYKDPFSFTPSHTLVLYTNHLPKVSGNDDGIWRRLKVIPFNNKLTGTGDIKNYADYLYENAGEYILTWIIEGAKKIIDANLKLKVPKCVEDAINYYREQNDWFHHFIDDCCEIDESYKESSSKLYAEYRRYCQNNGEYIRSTSDFYTALEHNGFNKIVVKRIKFINGLKLIPSAITDFQDYLE